MLLKTIVLFAASVAAWTVPESAVDGTYSVSLDSTTGKEVHKFIAPIDNSLARAPQVQSAKFAKRNLNGHIYCAGQNLDHGDTDRANGALDAQCGGGATVGENLDFYSISGNTVAYFCNIDWGFTNTCSAGDRQDASRQVTNGCGWYVAGDLTVPVPTTFTKTATIVYGYQVRNAKFCGRGTSGR